jgi:uncharacterized protein (TIGR03382 family)
MTMTSLHKRLLRFGAIGGLVLGSRAAHAAPNFPRNIQSELKLDYAPPCSICHVNGQTGEGTPIELFAWSMRARGLTGSRNSLVPALMADETDNVDSDGDGITDIDELRNGTDVNSPANDCIIPSGTHIEAGQCTPGTPASPLEGCALTSLPDRRSSTEPPLAAALLLLALVALERRRRGVATRQAAPGEH